MPTNQTDYKIDNMRKAAKKRFHLTLWLTLLLFLIVCAGVLALANAAHGEIYGNDIVVVVAVGFGCAIAGFFILYWLLVKKKYDQFNATYKESYVLEMLQQNPKFKNVYYSPKAGLPYQTMKRVGAVPVGMERYFESEDMLSGSYRNVKFFISDVVTKKTVYRDGKNEIDTLFSGQVICLEGLPKKSDSLLQVIQKGFPRMAHMGHVVRMEWEAFNDIFQVYAENPHNAFFMLTPQKTEQLVAFAKAVQIPFSVVFESNRIFIALHSQKSMFDADMTQALHKQKASITKDVQGLEKALDIFLY